MSIFVKNNVQMFHWSIEFIANKKRLKAYVEYELFLIIRQQNLERFFKLTHNFLFLYISIARNVNFGLSSAKLTAV